jgi:hypothetical protein
MLMSAAVLLSGLAAGASVPSFDRVLVLDAGKQPAANVSIGDLDGDGSLDLLLVKGRHWPAKSRVLLGDGRGRFRAVRNLSRKAYRSYSGRLADLDGDGDLDVVLSNDAPDPKLTFLNDGKGRFTPGSAFGDPRWETRNASVADLDGDGRPDIVVANRTDQAPVDYVCINREKGRFDAACGAFAQGSATSITPADFDRDGRVDLAVPARDGGQSYVYLNGGNAVFRDGRRIPFGPPDATIRMAEAADLDGDGLLDIVAIDEKRGPAVYFGQRDTAFSPGLALHDDPVTPYALALADLNRDGMVDVVVGHVEAPSSLFLNDGSGRGYARSRFGDGKGTVYGFGIADLDGDGQVDVAAARSDAPSLVFFGRRRPAAPE